MLLKGKSREGMNLCTEHQNLKMVVNHNMVEYSNLPLSFSITFPLFDTEVIYFFRNETHLSLLHV